MFNFLGYLKGWCKDKKERINGSLEYLYHEPVYAPPTNESEEPEMKDDTTEVSEESLTTFFKRKLEDVCDLTCPRDCECWKDRHPDVLAAYENPTGPQGNTDLIIPPRNFGYPQQGDIVMEGTGWHNVNADGTTTPIAECECIACATETLTEENNMQGNPTAFEPAEADDVPEPATLWVEIKRTNPKNGFFEVKFRGQFYPFKLVDRGNEEFRPTQRFSFLNSTTHIVETTGEFQAIMSVDKLGYVTGIDIEGKSVDSIHLPINHAFFKYVSITLPMSQVL